MSNVEEKTISEDDNTGTKAIINNNNPILLNPFINFAQSCQKF